MCSDVNPETPPVSTAKTWSSLSTPHTPLTSRRGNKMPKLMKAGTREDYPPDFLDSVERIGIICNSLRKLEHLSRDVKKESKAKQKIWWRTGEAFKEYGDQMMTQSCAETFREACNNFYEISKLFPKFSEDVVVGFSEEIRKFNRNEVKEVKENLKSLAKARKNLEKAKKKVARQENEATTAAATTMQGEHDTCFATAKESMLKFMRETAFFDKIADKYVNADRELCDKVYEMLNSKARSNEEPGSKKSD
ncbi:hypothetical protein RB195_020936 [Necator americanus]|uniref:BAR domain-containing protein n=1 Tax=Necator americanus TaxID=51031 RepID=A0ABR1CNZ1_NECAM